jgi:hypothetical protein
LQIAGAALLTAFSLQPVAAQESAADAEAAAQASWRDVMAHNPNSEQGCFEATYPSTAWERVECKQAPAGLHMAPPRRGNPGAQTVGNGADYVAESSGLITQTVGSFPTVTGVKTEKSVGVASFGGGGILGPNEYTLQINTQFTSTTPVCGSHKGCTVWQQFVYATDYYSYPNKGEAAVFIEYWIFGYGNSCPTNLPWQNLGQGECVLNSNLIEVPNAKAKTLGTQSLTATAAKGGNDTAIFTIGTKAYTFSGSDSVVDIADVWKQSEFNVVGDAGGSEAVFNKKSSVTVKVALTDGSTSAPTCLSNAGTTGETNNFNAGPCSTGGGTSPYIQFTESN